MRAGRVRSVLNIMLGAMSFMMLLDGAWWYIGIIAAIMALILGWPGRKNRQGEEKKPAIAGVVLAIAGTLAYLVPELIRNS